MDQFNRNTYKQQSLFQQFTGSCIGKIIIMLGAALVLSVFAIISVPTESEMMTQTEDKIRQCLQDNDSIRGDMVDDIVANVVRTFSEADTTVNDQARLDIFHHFNRVEVYNHTLYSTAHIINNLHPQGVRVAWGIFGIVVATVYYDDIVMDNGPVRGAYNKKLIQYTPTPDDDTLGTNPLVNPYHYEGNPDN